MGRSGLTPHPAGQSHRLSRRGPSAHWGWQRRHPVRRGCSQNCHCVSTVAGCVSTAAVLELPARLLTKMGGSLCCCGEGEGFFYRQNWQFPSLDSRDLIQAAHSTHSAIQLYSMHSGISHLLRKDLSFEKVARDPLLRRLRRNTRDDSDTRQLRIRPPGFVWEKVTFFALSS
nr:uncharacterized protein LOC107966375 isoform X3 [Pan troglodytes]XP_054540769.1 uncharacterized protein LOC107966375 isoform X3 [Pan troglodytes]